MPQAYDNIITPARRKRIEDTVDRLIAFLDAADSDPDLEDGGDLEPDDDGETDLGWPEQFNQAKNARNCQHWGSDHDREQDSADDEPSLGSLDGVKDQRRWSEGDRRDMEADYVRCSRGYAISSECADRELDGRGE